MRRFSAIACVLAACMSAAAAAPETKIMPVSEVAKGMKGKGRSVFQGTKIEQFDVEIVGVLKDVLPKGSIILARVDTPNLYGGGIIAGMSGSPVYVQGKLVGAIAFSWPFAKNGICGITPIEDMLSTLPSEPPGEAAPTAIAKGEDEAAALRAGPASSSGPSELQPLQTPVMVSCWSEEWMAKLRPRLAEYGMAPVQAGAGPAGGAPASAGELRPGSSIGVRLIGGDMQAVAVGTVTYREGDRILALGHPFVNAGRMAIPMTGAYVYGVMPSQEFSFKLAGGTDPVGVMDLDRRYAIGGKLGAACATVPCDVSIRSAIDGKVRAYHYELADHRHLTPMLAGWALAASYARTERVIGQTMADLRFETWIAGREKPFVLENRFFDDGNLAALLMEYGDVLKFITQNPFGPLRIERVRAVADLAPGHQTAIIQGMKVSRRLVKPGEIITVTAQLLPYPTGKIVEKSFPVRIPPEVPEGMRLPVVVCDATTSLQLRMQSAPGAYRPRTMEDLLRWIEEIPRQTDLFVHMALPSQGVTFRGTRLPDLPGSLVVVVGDSNESGGELMRGAVIERERTDWILMGAAMLPVYTIKE